jgi:uncharacterized protein with NAD-binding domain and iron-sulfur cluster
VTGAPQPTTASTGGPAVPKKKVAILGGGQAALTVALQLTDPANPHHADYDITIYQLGWRLGGKGATGRPVGRPWDAERIEEHGLHTWFGFYDNSFRQMRVVFDELNRPAGSPLATFDDAFEGVNEMVFVEQIGGQPRIWTLHNPTNGQQPGIGGMWLKPWAYVQMALELIALQLTGSNLPWVAQIQPLLVAVDQRLQQLAAEQQLEPLVEGMSTATPIDVVTTTSRLAAELGRSRDSDERLPDSPLIGLFDEVRRSIEVEKTAGTGQPFGAAAPFAGLWPAPCGGDVAYTVMTWLMSLFMGAFWDAVKNNIETAARDTERHLWIEGNLAYACIRGAMCDGVFENGFDVINDIDFRAWIAKHQYADGGVLQRSPLLEAIYTASFAYPAGAAGRAPGQSWPPAENMEAGSGLRGLVRTALTYKGSFAYRFTAGTADTCFSPIYELLTTKRGVRVEFFHRVEQLKLGAGGIARIELARQAQVTPAQQSLGGYHPLVDVHGLPCWPNSPLWGQLVDGALLEGIEADFENPTAAVRAHETAVTLQAGTDFDIVVLGIPVGAHKSVAADLITASQRWKDSVDHVKTVRTQALQVWLTRTGANLGLTGNHATATWFYNAASHLNVLGDFSEILPMEWWPAGAAPTFLGYLCSTMPDGPGDPFAPFPDQVAADAQVRQNAIGLLDAGLPILLPGAKAVAAPGFDWPLLFDGRPIPGVGSARIDSQYYRANVTPTERYVLSVVGSTVFRLPAHDPATFPNLYLAGDWTVCNLNAGCMEAATMSGMLCSNAIDGYPTRAEIIGADF